MLKATLSSSSLSSARRPAASSTSASLATVWRSLIIGVLLVASLLLTGCSAVRLAYNQAPTLAYWWLDAYVGFDETQSPKVKEAVAEWFAWHRAAQLPELAVLLVRAQAQASEAVTPEQVCGWNDELTKQVSDGFAQALPALAQVALTLTPAQLQRMERKYADGHQEYAKEYLQANLDERRKLVVNRTVERAERLYGRLEPAQRERIAQGVAASPFDPHLWLAERKARQQDILRALRQIQMPGVTAEQARAELRGVGDRLRQSPRAEYVAYQRKLVPHNCQMAADIHNAASPAQRASAVGRLKGWEGDVRALASQAR